MSTASVKRGRTSKDQRARPVGTALVRPVTCYPVAPTTSACGEEFGSGLGDVGAAGPAQYGRIINPWPDAAKL